MKYRSGYLRRTVMICAAIISLGLAAPTQAFLWGPPVRRWIREADRTLEEARQAESENRILEACDAYSRAHELYFKVQTESPRTHREHVARQDAECRSRLRTLFTLAAAGEVEMPSPDEVIAAATGSETALEPPPPTPPASPPAAAPAVAPETAPAADEAAVRSIAIAAPPPPPPPPIIQRRRPEKPAAEKTEAEPPVRRTWYGRRIRTAREHEKVSATEELVTADTETELTPTAAVAPTATIPESEAEAERKVPGRATGTGVMAVQPVKVKLPAATVKQSSGPETERTEPEKKRPTSPPTPTPGSVAGSGLSPRIQQMLREGAGADAVIMLEALIEQAGDHATLEEQLLFAQALINRRNYKRAEAVLDPLLEQHPENPAVLMLASGLQFAMGKPYASLLYLDRLVLKYPRFAEAYVNLAYTRFAMDPVANRAEAVSYYRNALRLGAERDPRLELELRVNVAD